MLLRLKLVLTGLNIIPRAVKLFGIIILSMKRVMNFILGDMMKQNGQYFFIHITMTKKTPKKKSLNFY